MESLSRTIGMRIRQARERLGLTQEELGRRLAATSGETRFSTSMVSLLEAGSRPLKVEDLQWFSEALGISPAHLLGDTILMASPTSEVRQVLLRATRFLHPGARAELEQFIDCVEEAPPSPAPVVRIAPTMRARDLVKAAGYARPRVDPFDIARKVGLQVLPADLDEDVSGVLILNGEKRVIGVNENQPLQRQRFSVAHEIGHYIKGHTTTVDIDVRNPDWFVETGANAIEERQANAFAAELLMPTDWLERDIRALSDDPAELADHYGVSKQAMWIRLMEVGLVAQ